jgi:NFACT N-terminal and middle domains/NFACT protein RNA binding domain
VTDRDDGFARRHGSAQPGAKESSAPIRLTIVASYLHHPDVSKAIRYDSLLLRALARELDERYAGRGIRAIRITPDTRTLAIVSRRTSLLWNIDADDGFLIEQAERGRPNGVILPRGTRTAVVRTRPDDRTIHWVLETPADEGNARRFELWIELLPSRRAAVLTAGDRVLASMGPVARAGAHYEPPSAAVRGDSAAPLSFDAFAERLRPVDPSGRERVLLRTVAWTSPLNAGTILGEAGESNDEVALAAAWERYRAIVSPAEGGAAVLLDPGGSDQPYPAALPGTTFETHPDLLSAFAARAPVVVAPDRAALTAEIGRRIERLEKRLDRLGSELEGASREAVRLRHQGELLLSHPGAVRRGMREIVLDDWAGGNSTIELDPSLDAIGNAEAMFDAARRRERAAQRLPDMIARVRADISRQASVLERLVAGSVSDEELEAWRPAATSVRPGPTRAALPYRRYRTAAGSEIRVGRGARANDELTFHHSGPEDIWLHARDVGGAHVVLRWSRRDENPSATELATAAVLAAVHSRARTSGVVAVDWTRRKYVRKPRGSPPGRVTIERAKTVFVEPDAELETRLRVD